MATLGEVQKLYEGAKYHEVIAASEEDPKSFHKLALRGWAHHQLGEYRESIITFRIILNYPGYNEEEIIVSSKRGLAHGLLQAGGDISEVEKLMAEIPPGLDLDNVYMNVALKGARVGLPIRVDIIMNRILGALAAVPYKTVSGHIVNNGAMVLYEARTQEAVKPYIPTLPGLIYAAIGIYEATGTAKNHIAGAEYRAAQICKANGWLKLARLSAEESVGLWRELVNSQGGERYQKNLVDAEDLLREILLAKI